MTFMCLDLGAADMVFALGGNVEAAEFANQKLVAAQLLPYFLVSKKYVHLGLVIYGKDVDIISDLKDLSAMSTLGEKIKLAASPTRGGNLKEVLSTLMSMFSPQNGAREFVQKSFVLFIDDKTVMDLPKYKYEINKLIENGIKPVIVVSGSEQVMKILPDWLKKSVDIVSVGEGSSGVVDKIRAGMLHLVFNF